MRIVFSLAIWVSLLRKKLAMRLQEAAEAVGVANARNASLERARHRLQLELADALSDLRQARSAAAALDQKQRLSDKSLEDQKQKHEESQAMLDTAQKEARALSTELLKLRHAYEESTMSQETLRRENENLRGTLHPAWSPSGSRELRGVEAGFQSKAALHRPTSQHCHGPCRFSLCRL